MLLLVLSIMEVRWLVVLKNIYKTWCYILNRAINTGGKPIVDIFVSCFKGKKLKST